MGRRRPRARGHLGQPQDRPPLSTPPPHVLRAFGIDDVTPVAGGQGTVFGTDALVLKPTEDHVEATWLADLLDALPRVDDLRVLRPVRTCDGAWLADGWMAFERLAGAHDGHRWRDALAVSTRFHALVADWPRPRIAEHPWSIGDRWAWGEHDIDVPERHRAVVDQLLAARHDVDAGPPQLVHGDLGGNILFDRALPPAVIDISPMWRPKAYADAIVVADAAAWFDEHDAIGAVDPQLLVRAVLFRIGSCLALFGDGDRFDAEIAKYDRLVRTLRGNL